MLASLCIIIVLLLTLAIKTRIEDEGFITSDALSALLFFFVVTPLLSLGCYVLVRVGAQPPL